jgi:hypothetical protein
LKTTPTKPEHGWIYGEMSKNPIYTMGVVIYTVHIEWELTWIRGAFSEG